MVLKLQTCLCKMVSLGLALALTELETLMTLTVQDQARGSGFKHMQKTLKGWSRDCNSCLAWHVISDPSHCSELNA